MSTHEHSRPRHLAAVPTLLAVAAVLACLPAIAGAGGRSSSYSWSSSSGKGVRSESTGKTANGHYSTVTTSDDDEVNGSAEVNAWLFSRDNGESRNGSGSSRDWAEAERAVGREDGDVFWFRRGSDRYLVTDDNALSELKEIFAPEEELGRRQGELGRRQGELGRLQGELGRRQGELGRIQAEISRVQAVVALQDARRAKSGDDDADDMESNRREMERRQNEASELQSELGEQQRILGERQSVLGEEQGRLGREQARIAKQVGVALDKLTRDLVADGRAKRIGR